MRNTDDFGKILLHKIRCVWYLMKSRCNNKNNKAYKNYGGRGINVCAEWSLFENFYNWSIDNGYGLGLEIDRIDNNSGYSPNNCRWTTRVLNIRNSRVSKLDMSKANEIRKLHNNGEHTNSDLAKIYGVVCSTIKDIISNKTWRKSENDYKSSFSVRISAVDFPEISSLRNDMEPMEYMGSMVKGRVAKKLGKDSRNFMWFWKKYVSLGVCTYSHFMSIVAGMANTKTDSGKKVSGIINDFLAEK